MWLGWGGGMYTDNVVGMGGGGMYTDNVVVMRGGDVY